jgi:hypothetical protein
MGQLSAAVSERMAPAPLVSALAVMPVALAGVSKARSIAGIL